MWITSFQSNHLQKSNHLQWEVVNAVVTSDWAQTQVHACPLAVLLCGQGGHLGPCELRG